MKAFITGITGFAGGFLAEHLLAAGDQVMGSSRGGTWPASSPAALSAQVPVVAWDVGEEPLASARQQIVTFAPDVIYHLAAISIPSQCGQQQPSEQAIAINVAGTGRVLELAAAMTDQRPRGARVVFTSSSHVYAPATAECFCFDETAPTEPARGYGQSKLLAEGLIQRAVAAGQDAVIVRAFQHAGPRQLPQLMLAEWAAQFAKGDDTPVQVVNRDTTIDLSDVRDVVRAYRLLATHAESGEIFNVGAGVPRRTGDILAIMQRLAGQERAIIETRPGTRYDPVANITHITSRTGWRPEIALEKTIADTVRHFVRE